MSSLPTGQRGSKGRDRPVDGQSGGDGPAKRARPSPAPRTHGLTVRDLITDELAPLANLYWAPSSGAVEPFAPNIIENIYSQHLAPVNTCAQAREERDHVQKVAGDAVPEVDAEEARKLEDDEEREQAQIEAQRAQKLLLLELSAYLENYLWKNFDAQTASFAHVMSIIMLLNQKFKENLLGIWDCFSSRADEVLLSLFDRILLLKLEELSTFEGTQFLTFLIHAYQSFEHPLVRRVFMRLATVDCWRSLRDVTMLRVLRESTDGATDAAAAVSSLRDVWKSIQSKPVNDLNATFLPNLIVQFVTMLYSLKDDSPLFALDSQARRIPYRIRANILFLERFLEFLTDCLTKRSTRRWVKKLMEEVHFIVLCRESTLVRRTQAKEQAIHQQLATLAAKAKRQNKASDAMDLDVVQAQTATSGGAVLSNDNFNNTNASISPAALPGRLFVQLLAIVEYYQYFEIDDVSGKPLGAQEVLKRHLLDIQLLQMICFKFFSDVPQLLNIARASVSQLDGEAELTAMLVGLSAAQLSALCVKLQLLPRDEEVAEYQLQQSPPKDESEKKSKKNKTPVAPTHVARVIVDLLPHMTSEAFLRSLLVSKFVVRRNTREEIASMPLFPSEQLLFDEHAIPSVNYTGDTCLSLPKLNLQFLTIHDYLQRNFHLYKGESTYEIREDIAYTIKRLKPRISADAQGTVFTGWARMATPLITFSVTEVLKPLIGETKPSLVRAEIKVDLSVFNGIVREEWEALRQHDVLFLLNVQALVPIHASAGNAMTSRQGGDDRGRRRFDVEGSDLDSGAIPDESFKALASEPLLIRTVRGCRVHAVLDQYKKLIGGRDEKGNIYKAKGSERTFCVELDAAQYAEDQQRLTNRKDDAEDVYSGFNLLLRRKPKENNFAAVLETIRDLMADTARGTAAIPDWLKNVFLGYGDPRECQYHHLPGQLQKLEFVDTFVDLQHLKESFHEQVTVADRSAEDIEAELRGEKEVSLVALGTEGNNRQTAASTSIALTRQVMRLVAQAQKENKAKSGDAASSALESLSSTFRVKFPLAVEPNLEVLQKLLYVNDASLAASVSHADPNVRFMLNEGEAAVKVAEALEHTEDAEMDESTSAVAAPATEGEQRPIAPVFEELVAPAPLAPQAFSFTLKEPAKPVASAAAAAPSAATPAATAAADSSDVEAEISALNSLTVPKIKDLMKPLGLSVVGTKAVLIERLAESMRANVKAPEAAEAAPAAAADSAAEVTPEALAKYESDLAAYQMAFAAHNAAVAKYEAETAAHEALVSAHAEKVAAQAEQRKAHDAAVKAFEKRAKAAAKKATTESPKKKAADADGDVEMEDAPAPSSAGKSKKKGGSGKKKSKKALEAEADEAAPAVSAAAAASAVPAVPAFVIPPSEHKLEVEMLPRVHARHGYQKRNLVRFTPIQVEAIKSGLNPGLTLIVGPPGTGKTDTAVQIISELYHNFPEQRTLLITHSNHALNALFEKVAERDIDERYLLRLGRGSEDVAFESDMSKFGRVNYMLQRRLTLLEEVAALARSLQMSDDVAYTCETSGHFFLSHILARWEKFTAAVQAAQKEGKPDLDAFIAANFPFTQYFTQRTEKQDKIWHQYYKSQYGANAMQMDAPAAPVSLFRSANFSEDMSIAVSCFAELQTTFVELEECRPFELLRSYKDRGNYLLTKHAKIIAMTCTHAAIKRKDLVDLQFQFENIVMEESAQILEIETFIPMLLQRTHPESGSRLKRIILLGDHHQLPPVIKNRAFQKYSHMDQSLFTRFIRLGMPHIQLNAQGRMRSSLAQLWNWNYQNLGNLPVINQNPAYQYGNVGFAHDYQLINVEDLNGVGESSPTPFFYQNLAEAEYVVQTYMYMRLLGYPANRISILTTYNGQKHLIRDILTQRCANNLLFGLPDKVSTVDKFQGQQNDIILLSLVRTRTAGHLRDVRRLVVAMSRARLGMYIFGRISLFSNCFELTRTFNQLLQRPVRLQLLPQEKKPMDQPLATSRLSTDVVDPAQVLEVRDVLHMGELVAAMTLSVQSEYGEYARRIAAAQEEERMAREHRERLAREYAEAREATQRAEAQQAAQTEREIAFAKQTDALEKERDDEERGAPAKTSQRAQADSDASGSEADD